MTIHLGPCVLAVAMSAAMPLVAFTQAPRSGPQGKSSSHRESTMPQVVEAPRGTPTDKTIRPFRISVPETALIDLKNTLEEDS